MPPDNEQPVVSQPNEACFVAFIYFFLRLQRVDRFSVVVVKGCRKKHIEFSLCLVKWSATSDHFVAIDDATNVFIPTFLLMIFLVVFEKESLFLPCLLG